MSLRERLKTKAHAWVKREVITLPETGERIQIRGLVAGELNRINQAPAAKKLFTQTALSCEDPDTNLPLWNPNLLEDEQEIDALPGADLVAISEVIDRLSGGGKAAEEQGKENSSETERNSTISSPFDSASPSATSTSESPESNG